MVSSDGAEVVLISRCTLTRSEEASNITQVDVSARKTDLEQFPPF